MDRVNTKLNFNDLVAKYRIEKNQVKQFMTYLKDIYLVNFIKKLGSGTKKWNWKRNMQSVLRECMSH